jgi:hypothetical protein
MDYVNATTTTAAQSPNTEKLVLKRGNVTITVTQRSPLVHTAAETVTWQTGGVQITGFGIDRKTALDNLEKSFDKLKEVLAIAD